MLWTDFVPPGRPVLGLNSDWNKLALTPLKEPSAVVHVAVFTQDGKVLLIFDKGGKKFGDGSKPAAWELPTETVRFADEIRETPFQAANRAIREELNMNLGSENSDITIHPRPIRVADVRRENGEVIRHFLFSGTMELFTDVPVLINDPAGNVKKATVLIPQLIHVPLKEDANPPTAENSYWGWPCFTLDGQREIIFPAHCGYLATAWKSLETEGS